MAKKWKTSDELVADAIVACERAMNTFGDKSAFAMKVGGMHPTLQQTFFSNIVLAIVRKFSENCEKGWYDERNKMACEVAKVMWDAVKEKYNIAEDAPFHLPLV